ncbi:hypothetical protein HanRHA438_Chr03g0142671 [Helianthus annuus]|nr:hypothetical protein HanRHA438_Chr03g0142671 [Helianthus annuus]
MYIYIYTSKEEEGVGLSCVASFKGFKEGVGLSCVAGIRRRRRRRDKEEGTFLGFFFMGFGLGWAQLKRYCVFFYLFISSFLIYFSVFIFLNFRLTLYFF